MPCVMLLFSMFLASRIGRQFFDAPENVTKADFLAARKTALAGQSKERLRMTKNKTGDYIWAFEESMMLCELLRCGFMTVGFVNDRLTPYIRTMMERWTNSLPRFLGKGWCLVKYHNILHLTETLVMMGTAKGTDTETGEHLHVGTKGDAQNTQRQRKNFDQQVGNRMFESMLARRAREEVGRTKKRRPTAGHTTKPPPMRSLARVSCSRFKVGRDGKIDTCGKEWHDKELLPAVEAFLRLAVCAPMACDSLNYYTEANIALGEHVKRNILFRADPAHHSQRRTNSGWHDLAIAKNPTASVSPEVAIQMFGFLRFDNLKRPFILAKKYNNRQLLVEAGSEWAICHAFISKPPVPWHTEGRRVGPGRLHTESRLLSVSRKKLGKVGDTNLLAPEFFLVPLEDIRDTCIGVPNLQAVETIAGKDSDYCLEITDDHEYIFVQSREKWPLLYMDWVLKETEGLEKPTKEELEQEMDFAAAPPPTEDDKEAHAAENTRKRSRESND